MAGKNCPNRDPEAAGDWASLRGTMNLAGDAQAVRFLAAHGSARTSSKNIEVHDFYQSLWRDPFAQGRKSVHVAKHDRHHATLAFSGSERWLLEQSFGNPRIDIPAVGFSAPLVVAQCLDHAIE